MRRKPFVIFLSAAAIASGALFLPTAIKPKALAAADLVPVQHNGRVKSFSAFARQTVELITGKQSWQGEAASLVVLKALSDRNSTVDWKWIRVEPKELRSRLGLPEERSHFSYNELLPFLENIKQLVRSSQSKRDQDIRPSFLEQKAEILFTSFIETEGLLTGKIMETVPAEKKAPYEFKTRLEVFYLDARPFQWAWIAYLLAFLFLSVVRNFRFSATAGQTALLLALFFHTTGLVLRSLVLSRPPVSNMYESMIFMNWVLMIAAVIFSAVQKNLTPASIGSLVSALVMIYSDLLPIDPSLDVLVPVLRSNYWLTIHVLTIVSSYGVFGLAMGLGHRHLLLDVRGKLTKEEEERSAQLIYRVIQVGVLLIGIGTTLGGVWANESWGRFWGWDPKETWALITLLGYLVVVHLKTTKVLKPFSLAVSSILGFLLVLMTWYGVNFVLGRGLHSYGQGSGGLVWIVNYLLLEILFLAYILFKKFRIRSV